VLTFDALRTLQMFALFLSQELMVAGAQNLPWQLSNNHHSLLSSYRRPNLIPSSSFDIILLN